MWRKWFSIQLVILSNFKFFVRKLDIDLFFWFSDVQDVLDLVGQVYSCVLLPGHFHLFYDVFMFLCFCFFLGFSVFFGSGVPGV